MLLFIFILFARQYWIFFNSTVNSHTISIENHIRTQTIWQLSVLFVFIGIGRCYTNHTHSHKTYSDKAKQKKNWINYFPSSDWYTTNIFGSVFLFVATVYDRSEASKSNEIVSIPENDFFRFGYIFGVYGLLCVYDTKFASITSNSRRLFKPLDCWNWLRPLWKQKEGNMLPASTRIHVSPWTMCVRWECVITCVMVNAIYCIELEASE